MQKSERIFTYKGSADIPLTISFDGKYWNDFSYIVGHPATARLRRIGQLKPIDLVYPGANHTRFEHVLGVFGMAQDVVLKNSGGDARIAMTPYEKFLTLMIALLHDHGHGPYSHVYEIVAQNYGRPDHKQRCYTQVVPEMKDAIRKAAGNVFERMDAVDQIVEEMMHSGPLYRFVTDRDRLDKWDYTIRDVDRCQTGSVPDITTLINSLDFDEDTKESAFHVSAKDTLRTFFDALTSNNTSIYINRQVEVCEGFLIRAIANAIDHGLDIDLGYNMVDEQLNAELQKYRDSRDLMEHINDTTFLKNDCVQAAAIKYKGKAWLKDHETAQVEEVNDSEMKALTDSLDLNKVIALERCMARDMHLEPHEILITYSPQIDRLRFSPSSGRIFTLEGDRKIYRSIFDVSEGFSDYLTDRLKEHHEIRLTTTRENSERVHDFLESASFKDLLASEAGTGLESVAKKIESGV